MYSSRQLVGIAIGATLVSLGFVAWSYSVDNSHMTRFDHYFWMVLYFLFTMAVMAWATVAFQILATIQGWTILQGRRQLGSQLLVCPWSDRKLRRAPVVATHCVRLPSGTLAPPRTDWLAPPVESKTRSNSVRSDSLSVRVQLLVDSPVGPCPLFSAPVKRERTNI